MRTYDPGAAGEFKREGKSCEAGVEGRVGDEGRVKCEEVGVWMELPSVSVSTVAASPLASSLLIPACPCKVVTSSSSSEVGGSFAVVGENVSVSTEGPLVCFRLDLRLPNMIADSEPADEELKLEDKLALGDVGG